MSALAALPHPDHMPERPDTIDRALLTRLRLTACACRVAARMDASQTRLSTDGSLEQCITALVLTAPQGMGRSMKFYRPGTADISFDEAWLLSLVDAARRGDALSMRFMTGRRVAPQARDSVLFLVSRIAAAH